MIIPRVRITIIILSSLIGIALIGVGIWFVMSSLRKKTPPVSPNQNETSVILPGNTSKKPLPSVTETKKAEIAIWLALERFVSTYGSYSGSSNFENYKALFPYMTPALQKRAQKEIDAVREQQQPSGTMKSITTEMEGIKKLQRSSDGKEAEVIVTSFRKEYTATNSYRMFNQDIRLLIKEAAGSWLVDEIGWLPAQKN